MAKEAVRGLGFRIRHGDGREERLVVDSDHVLIGSGAHCEIRLPTEDAAVEHVAVTLVGGGVHAQARALEPMPTVNGSGFMQSPLLPDSVLGLGRVQVFVEVVDVGEGPNVIRKKANQTSPITYVAALIALPLAAYVLLADDQQDLAGEAPKDVPALWGPPIMACPQRDRDQALALAHDKKVLGFGMRERRPFRVQEGVTAVPTFETAAACFRVAGEGALSEEQALAARTLRDQINEDYRVHQVRLGHALSVNDVATSKKEVRVLRALTEGLSGPYVVWLGNLDRQLQLKGSRKE